MRALEVRLIKQDISARMGPWTNPFQVLAYLQVHRLPASRCCSLSLLSSSDSSIIPDTWTQTFHVHMYILQHLFRPIFSFFLSFFIIFSSFFPSGLFSYFFYPVTLLLHSVLIVNFPLFADISSLITSTWIGVILILTIPFTSFKSLLLARRGYQFFYAWSFASEDALRCLNIAWYIRLISIACFAIIISLKLTSFRSYFYKRRCTSTFYIARIYNI